MSNIPTQIRAIDPYASFHSNYVSRLTRVLSRGQDVIVGKNSLDVTFDSTAEQIITISPGYIIKDDILINVTNSFVVDMTDSTFYRTGTTPWDETGIYYVTVEYAYQKTKPAPEAKIRILKPSEQYKINEELFFFIGAVEVLDYGSGLFIEAVYGYDPDDLSIRRVYPPTDSNIVPTLPTFDVKEHEGQIIYDLETELLYWGSVDGWINIRASGEIVLDPADETFDYMVDKVRRSVEVVEDGGKYYLQLKNDVDTPGNKYVYATNDSGTKGWYSSTEIGAFESKIIFDNYTASGNEILLVGDSTGVLEITLPLNPENGDRVEVIDANRLFSINNVTIDGNTRTISGDLTYLLDTDYARYIFTYYSETDDWLVSKTLEETVLKSITYKVLPNEMLLDDTDVGSDGGNIFGIIESVDFNSSDDGSIWFPFRINDVENLELSNNIKINLIYSLNGNDSDKDVNLEFSYWLLDANSSTYDENTPDGSFTDSIVSDTDNIGKLDEMTMLDEIPNTELNENLEMIIVKLKRNASVDDYTGTFQLLSVILYQE